MKKLKVGLVTDVGKVDDKSFNQSAWEGVQQAVKELGVGSEVHRDDRPQGLCQEHRARLRDEKYDVIVTVGFAPG